MRRKTKEILEKASELSNEGHPPPEIAKRLNLSRRRIEQLLEHKRKAGFESEEDYRSLIADIAMMEFGLYSVEQKVKTKTGWGEADIVIYTNPRKVIEVKLRPDLHSISCALGQLLLISFEPMFQGAELFIACPEKISDRLLEALHKLGIKQWEEPWGFADPKQIYRDSRDRWRKAALTSGEKHDEESSADHQRD